jgi:hypothetical protein
MLRPYLLSACALLLLCGCSFDPYYDKKIHEIKDCSADKSCYHYDRDYESSRFNGLSNEEMEALAKKKKEE